MNECKHVCVKTMCQYTCGSLCKFFYVCMYVCMYSMYVCFDRI